MRRIARLLSLENALSRLALVVLACASLTTARGDEAPPRDLNALFKAGATAFNRGNYGAAITRFERVIKYARPGPVLEPVYYAVATAHLRKKDYDGAVSAFQSYIRTYPNGAQVNDARLGITTAYIAENRVSEALESLPSLRGLRMETGGIRGVDNYVLVQSVGLQVADLLLDEGKQDKALRLLQSFLWRSQAIPLQRLRIGELDRLGRLASASASMAGDANLVMASNKDALDERLKDAKAALKSLEDDPFFDVPRLLRQGRCYLETDSPWEAVVVFKEIVERFPSSPDKAYGLRGLILAKRALGRLDETQALCRKFVDAFGSGDMGPEIAVIGGEVSMQLEDYDAAKTFFQLALKGAKEPARESVVFQLGCAHFALNEWKDVRSVFASYLKDYPHGKWADNAAYRSAVSWFFDLGDADRYKKSETELKAFVAKHPGSAYLSDADYRLAICQFAFQEYPQAISACDDWEKRFPGDPLLPQVLSLKGDVQKTIAESEPDAAKMKAGSETAVATYLRAADATRDDEVLGHVLDEAAHLLERGREWDRLISIFSDRLDRAPDSPLAMGWYYWVVKAKAHAKAQAGEKGAAWDFLADSAAKFLDDPNNENVERIFDLMAQLSVRLRRPRDAGAPTPIEQFTKRAGLDGGQSPLVRARLSYYDSRVLFFSRKSAESEQELLEVGRETPADQLSAALLGAAGEALQKGGDTARAEVFFNSLLTRFPRSGYRDYAYVGLGNIALDKGDAKTALQCFDDAIKKTGAPQRQKEATIGQARSLLALGQLERADKLFELVATAKQWRGEATALSLYYLGEIAVAQGDLPKGIAFFQRVFVSQVRYPEWVAKSYVASGRAFEALGKPAEAAATYREMLRNERLKDRPELATARERIQALNLPSSS